MPNNRPRAYKSTGSQPETNKITIEQYLQELLGGLVSPRTGEAASPFNFTEALESFETGFEQQYKQDYIDQGYEDLRDEYGQTGFGRWIKGNSKAYRQGKKQVKKEASQINLPDMGLSEAGPAFQLLLDNYLDPQRLPVDANITNFTVDPSIIPTYQEGGEVEMLPIQTEKGEITALPDGTVSETKSQGLHKDMEDDFITDILPNDSWVFSEKVMVNKKDVDIPFGYSQPLYEEVPNDTTVEEINFNSLYEDDEEELSVAELARRIQKKFPINDQEKGNILTNVANIENKMSRLPYLEVLKIITENYLGEGEEENVSNPALGIPQFDKGGKVFVTPGRKIPHADFGLSAALMLASSALGLGTGISNLFSAGKQRREAKAKIEELTETQRANLQMGTLASLTSVLGQDPTTTAPDSSAALAAYKRSFDRMPQYVKENTYERINNSFSKAARDIFENTPGYEAASANLAGLYAQTLDKVGEAANQFAVQDMSMRENYLRGLSEFMYRDASAEAAAENATITNRNQQIAGLGNIASNYFNQDSINEASALSMEMEAEGASRANVSANLNSVAQNLMGLSGQALQMEYLKSLDGGNSGDFNYKSIVDPTIHNKFIKSRIEDTRKMNLPEIEPLDPPALAPLNPNYQREDTPLFRPSPGNRSTFDSPYNKWYWNPIIR